MKPNLNKMKLQLKKHVVSNLSVKELATVKGGNEEAWTTSKRACTGFLCCEPGPSATCTNTTTAGYCTMLTVVCTISTFF